MLKNGLIGKELPIRKQTQFRMEDPKLYVFLGAKVVVDGKYDGTVLEYKEVIPLVMV